MCHWIVTYSQNIQSAYNTKFFLSFKKYCTFRSILQFVFISYGTDVCWWLLVVFEYNFSTWFSYYLNFPIIIIQRSDGVTQYISLHDNERIIQTHVIIYAYLVIKAWYVWLEFKITILTEVWWIRILFLCTYYQIIINWCYHFLLNYHFLHLEILIFFVTSITNILL